MNLEDYAYNDDGRVYINPQVSLDEQNEFINNLRNTQAQDNAQIEAQTRALGTQVPSQLGGLTGAGGYFRSRYQTPQTNQAIADLKAAAQAQAINQSLQNEVNKIKKKYQDAYRANTVSSSKTSQSPLYDASADITGDLEFNTDLEGAGDIPDFYRTGRHDDEYVYYGLWREKRPDGLSDEEWDKWAEEWTNKKAREYLESHGYPLYPQAEGTGE